MLQLALINPVYAGAYACGRRRREDGGLGSGPPGQRRRCALEAPDVLLRDHHPAYLSRESYLSNRATRRDTTRQFATRRGAPPPGRAWLHGRVVWGRRGCRMQVHYSLPSPGYRCQTRHRRYGEPLGPSLALVPVAQAVSGAFLAVIRPAEIAALLALREEFGRERLQVERQWQPRLGRAAMTPSAHRQCDQCEPENRLVARALETRWDEKLRTVAELGEEHRQGQSRGLSPLEEEEKGVLRSLVGDGATRWHARATAVEDRKRLPRGLIREVVLPRDEGAQGAGGVPTLRGGGKSGARTELATHRPSSGEQARTPTAARERLRASAPRLPAERIAGPLDAEGFTTRLGLPWTTRRVERLRGNHEIPTGGPARPHNAQSRGDGLVPLRTAAQILGVTPGAPDHRRRWGFRHGEQRGADAPVWGRLTTAAVARLAGTVAAQGRGQGRLRRAQAILGLTPEELREQARRDELIAYRARVADHGEWRMSPAKTERGPPPTATAGG
jgi:hypothetical protein